MIRDMKLSAVLRVLPWRHHCIPSKLDGVLK